MTKVWNCSSVGAGLNAYAGDELAEEEARTLMDHLLSCPSCLMTVWRPFVEQSTRDAEDFLDEVLAVEEEVVPLTALTTGGLTGQSSVPNLAEGVRWEEDPWTHLPGEHDVGLRAVGMVLPRVPRDEVLSGYHLYLGTGAPRPLRTANSVVKLTVTSAEGKSSIQLEGIGHGAAVDGIPLGVGQIRSLAWAHVITCPLWNYTFETPREGAAWEGVGTLLYSGAWYPLVSPRTAVGRDTSPGTITLRDTPTQSNLEWRPGAREKLSPDERKKLELLHLDSYKVSRHHAELRKVSGGMILVGLKEFEVYRIRPGGEVMTSSRGTPTLDLLSGDVLKIGHQLFKFNGPRSLSEKGPSSLG